MYIKNKRRIAMEYEKEIKIVDDDTTVITYQMIETDSVNRAEIAEIKYAIESLEQEVAEKNAKIEELKAKVAFAEKIIALADEKIATENSIETNEIVVEC